jgi:hypothetical protein
MHVDEFQRNLLSGLVVCVCRIKKAIDALLAEIDAAPIR